MLSLCVTLGLLTANMHECGCLHQHSMECFHSQHPLESNLGLVMGNANNKSLGIGMSQEVTSQQLPHLSSKTVELEVKGTTMGEGCLFLSSSMVLHAAVEW